MVRIIELDRERAAAVAPLVADFRVTLKSYRGIVSAPDEEAGRLEILEYLDAGFPCFAAVRGPEYLGYLVCRVDAPCVWVESLYTRPDSRRRGVAAALLARAESIARRYGEETLFHFVHPNNHGMIAFLRRFGYTVLNLVEIRRPYRGEKFAGSLRVGDHEFDY